MFEKIFKMKTSLRNNIFAVFLGLISMFWIWRWTTFLIKKYQLSSLPQAGLICFTYSDWTHYVNIILGFLGIVIAIRMYVKQHIGILKWLFLLVLLLACYELLYL